MRQTRKALGRQSTEMSFLRDFFQAVTDSITALWPVPSYTSPIPAMRPDRDSARGRHGRQTFYKCAS